jgi:hypothetical protein
MSARTNRGVPEEKNVFSANNVIDTCGKSVTNNRFLLSVDQWSPQPHLEKYERNLSENQRCKIIIKPGETSTQPCDAYFSTMERDREKTLLPRFLGLTEHRPEESWRCHSDPKSCAQSNEFHYFSTDDLIRMVFLRLCSTTTRTLF